MRGDGIEVRVKASPRAGRDLIAGVAHDAAGDRWLSVRVAAAPDSGRANRAVLALLARALGVPASHCRIVAGATGRWKRVRIEGDPAHLSERAGALAAPPGGL